MSRHAVILAASLSAFTGGCNALDILESRGDETLVVGAEPIQTDSAVYRLVVTESTQEVTIDFSYTNATGRAVYIPTCRSVHPPVLQKLEGGTWVTVYSPIVLMCLGSPVVVDAGEVYQMTYRAVGSTLPSTFPRFETSEIPGTYRLVWGVLGTWTPYGSGGLGLPLEQRISNTFQIVE